jgi:BirA family biotin operon repressor/biotin-[acetyl-CoA-carboxylase] ligase
MEWLTEVGSTMDLVRARAEAREPEGLVIGADSQTAGRGRGGQRWLTPPGAQLAVSWLVRPSLAANALPRLTMWVGLGVHAALRELGAACDLKWPNDLLIRGRKLGGILVEGAFDHGRLTYAVVGLGLNLTWAPADDQVELPATSLADHVRPAPSRGLVLGRILTTLSTNYPTRLYDQRLVDAWRACLWWPSGPVQVRRDPASPVSGQVAGVDDTGALLIATGAQLERIETGSLRW